jgi:phosphoribosyl 1,2-cyclic phosphodiesterase
MKEGYCSLASGSKGNALVVATSKTRLLVDVGIRTKTLIERLSSMGIAIDTIDGILITHEHSDHVQGILTLIKRYPIPLFANAYTAKELVRLLGSLARFKIFVTDEPFLFQDIQVTPFSVPHDTVDPVGFALEVGPHCLSICTDLGCITASVRRHLEKAHYLYLESNHHPPMVHACSRPDTYKERVLGKLGHLSNEEASNLLRSLNHQRLRHVLLAHLSEECNRPELAQQLAIQALNGSSVSVEVASQYQHSSWIHFGS